MKKLSTEDLKAAAELKGQQALVIYKPHSYRGGQTTVVCPQGFDFWKEPFSFKKMDLMTFDGTGYDGRGRRGVVYKLTPGGEYLLTEDELVEQYESTLCVGTSRRDKVYFYKPSEKEGLLGSIGELFDDL